MKGAIHHHSRSKIRGSSTLLVILVVVSFVVVVALMVRSSSELTKQDRKAGNQETAIDSTMETFNVYDSIMDESADAADAAESKGGVVPTTTLPMHLTDQPVKKDRVKTPLPPPSLNTGAMNAPRPELEPLSPGTTDDLRWKELGDAAPGEESFAPRHVPGGAEQERKRSVTVVEPIDPDSTLAPEMGGPVFIRENRGPAASVELAAGREAPAKAAQAADPARQEFVTTPITSEAVNLLSPPLFSIGTGKFPMSKFNLRLKLANPNPQKVSRVLYSFDSTHWKLYDEKAEIIIPPGTTVVAYSESLDPKWRDSPEETRDYRVDLRKLEAPRISASASAFDKKINRRILVSMVNPNSLSESRIEYRINGGLWHPYTVPFNLDADEHWVTGVSVETRVVAVRGTPRAMPSESVALEIGRPETHVLAASAPEEVTAIDPRAVDLGMNTTAHGYSERGFSRAVEAVSSPPPQFVSTRTSDVDAAWSGRGGSDADALATAVTMGLGNAPGLALSANGGEDGNPDDGAGFDAVGIDLFESAVAAEVLSTEFVWDMANARSNP